MNKRTQTHVHRKKDENILAWVGDADPDEISLAGRHLADGHDGWPYTPAHSNRPHPGFNHYLDLPDGAVAFNEYPRDIDHCREVASHNFFIDGEVSREPHPALTAKP